MEKDIVIKKLHEKYGKQSSFAIWADSQQKDKVTGDFIDFQSAIDAEENLKVRFDRVILLINPSNKQKNNPEENFSAFHHKGVTDRNMRYVLKNVRNYQEYYGAYLTDLYPDIQNSVSSKVVGGQENEISYFINFMNQLDILADATSNKIKILFTGVVGNTIHQRSVDNLIMYLKQHINEYEKLKKVQLEFEGTWQFGM
ncbi:hypothetical protein [Liquorilactobacillus sp.]|uniref:hypothetical protein n=1 Tax=Liquorilactobacillus sp. TaxID=2767923 RepID=UPI0039E7C53B